MVTSYNSSLTAVEFDRTRATQFPTEASFTTSTGVGYTATTTVIDLPVGYQFAIGPYAATVLAVGAASWDLVNAIGLKVSLDRTITNPILSGATGYPLSSVVGSQVKYQYPTVAAMLADTTAWPDGTLVEVPGLCAYTKQSTGTGAVGPDLATPPNYFKPIATVTTPEMFGAPADGVHDDAPAIQASHDASDDCLATGNYTILSTVLVRGTGKRVQWGTATFNNAATGVDSIHLASGSSLINSVFNAPTLVHGSASGIPIKQVGTVRGCQWGWTQINQTNTSANAVRAVESDGAQSYASTVRMGYTTGPTSYTHQVPLVQFDADVALGSGGVNAVQDMAFVMDNYCYGSAYIGANATVPFMTCNAAAGKSLVNNRFVLRSAELCYGGVLQMSNHFEPEVEVISYDLNVAAGSNAPGWLGDTVMATGISGGKFKAVRPGGSRVLTQTLSTAIPSPYTQVPGNTATVYLAYVGGNPVAMPVGAQIVVAGCTPTGYNGTWTVTASVNSNIGGTNYTAVSYTVPSDPGPFTGNGTLAGPKLPNGSSFTQPYDANITGVAFTLQGNGLNSTTGAFYINANSSIAKVEGMQYVTITNGSKLIGPNGVFADAVISAYGAISQSGGLFGVASVTVAYNVYTLTLGGPLAAANVPVLVTGVSQDSTGVTAEAIVTSVNPATIKVTTFLAGAASPAPFSLAVFNR